jgi:hypothetical protein
MMRARVRVMAILIATAMVSLLIQSDTPRGCVMTIPGQISRNQNTIGRRKGVLIKPVTIIEALQAETIIMLGQSHFLMVI